MRNLLSVIIIFVNFSLYSQCFDCHQNIGGWVDDSAIDVEKTSDGFIFLVDSNGFVASQIHKYDFNCNLIWSKTFGYVNVDVKAVTSDELGNIYIVIRNTTSTNAGLGPWNTNGFMMSPGLNFYKLDSAGNILWTRHIGPEIGPAMQDIHYYQNQLFITGTFYSNLTFINGLNFSYPYTNYPRAFIAKYDTDGNFINAINQGNGNENFKYSEIDNEGNIYLTRTHRSKTYSAVDKFSSSLDLSWTKILSTSNTNDTGIYDPTGIRFNKENNKLYLWGKMNLTTTISDSTFFINNTNSIFQSALTELNTSNGEIENVIRFDNSSSYSISSSSAVVYGRSAYMNEKNGYLYILTSFRGTMAFPNGIATSTSYYNDSYYSEDLILFKLNLSDYTSEFIFQSFGVNNLSFSVTNLPGNMFFKEDELYLTSTFGSKPMQLNGSIINNNSGNNDPDAMFYKFSINSSNSNGSIEVNNTCLNDLTQFNLNGNFNSIIWDFGDPTSSDNYVSGINNPTHLFSSLGTYIVKATITCFGDTYVVEKEIVITSPPIINNINPIIECETISGSGISSNFDTSTINNQLIDNQENITIKFRNSNGQSLPSPLPNPYTNSLFGGDNIIARVFNSNNENCYVETVINFNVISKPDLSSVITQQTFCIQENATLNDILITGQNITWYDSQSNGNNLADTTLLQNGNIYYASQIINGCESDRMEISVVVNDTPPVTGTTNQNFCSTENATLQSIIVNGTDILWYESNTSTTPLPDSTLLIDNTTYFATQTLNGCESTTRLAVSINLINTLNANDYTESICDDLNDGVEIIDLTSYNSELIASNGNVFHYYHSLNGAENQITSDEIANTTNFELLTGNKIIYIRIDSPNTCFQIVELDLTLYNKPIIEINDIMPICDGNEITINAGNGFDNYNWSTGETTPSIIVSQPGNYDVTVSEIHGPLICTSTKNFTVVLSNPATITNIETKDWTTSENIIQIDVTGLGNYEYSLDNINFQDSNLFTNLPSGDYTIYVRDKNDCGTVDQKVYLLMYPLFFTPNGDGYNDKWKIKFSEIEPNMTVTIFDRYGKFIKQIGANSEGWDGTFLGNHLPSSDYWFVVTRQNGKEYRGHFSLKR